MREVTVFISDDGEQFSDQEDCLEWERIRERVKALERDLDCICWSTAESPSLDWLETGIGGLEAELLQRLLFEHGQSAAITLEKLKGCRRLSDFVWEGVVI